MNGVAVGQINLDITVSGFAREMVGCKESPVRSIRMGTGGDAQNAATAMAGLGLRMRLVGRVGADEAGEVCARRTAAAGVDCRGVRRIPGGETGSCVALLPDQGEASFLYTPGENRRLSLKDIDMTLLEGAGFLSIHSLYALPALDCPALLRAARGRGILTFADTTNLSGGERVTDLEDTLALLDIFAPSYAEGAVLTGAKAPEDIVGILLAHGARAVILKLGREGCVVGERGGTRAVPGFPARVVDTTGAGDHFAAGLLYGISTGKTLPQAAVIANAAGAHAVGFLGANGHLTSPDQLKTFL